MQELFQFASLKHPCVQNAGRIAKTRIRKVFQSKWIQSVSLLGTSSAITLIMKINLYLPLLVGGVTLVLCSCASSDNDRPIPGTVEATSTKDNSNINNTPRTNPTPNPDPESQPPDQVTRTTVIQQ